MSDDSAMYETLEPSLLREMERLCAQFERDLKAGGPTKLAEFLDRVPDTARHRLFRDLLEVELRHREQAGRPLAAEEAQLRYGSIGPWAGLVLEALGLGVAEETLLLEVLEGPAAGKTFRLTGHASFFVGRGEGAHLALTGDKTLSRVHLCIEYNPPRARLSDCNSKNGTYHNQKRLEPEAAVDLRDGDQIRAGDVLIGVRMFGGDPTASALPPTDPFRFEVPEVAGRLQLPGYTVEEELGRGGMGVVHRARRHADNREVAVKVVLPALMPHPETRARFQREIDILRQLEHPNIVRLYETGMAAGLVYFVMEFVEGCSAGQLVKRSGPLPLQRVVDLGCKLLDALAHAHECGFVHRDVKPGNLLVSGPPDARRLKLADFGLARAYEASAMSGLTRSGQSGGTPEFMPPEQVRDFRTARPAADQYSAAASLYHLATGEHIYERAATKMDLLVRILQEEPVPLRPGPPHPALDNKLGPILCRALAREPGKRFPDVSAMRRALNDVRT